MSHDLDDVKATLLAKIEADAAKARAVIATPGAPYAEKLAEADRYLADGIGGPWPFLDAEAARLGGTRTKAAEMIRGRAAETAVEMADIEIIRGQARDAVKAATTKREAVEAFNRVEW